MDAPVRDFDSAADTQQAEGGSARQKTAGRQEKTGDFSRKMGDFRGKVGRFSPVGGECLLHLGGNDGGLAAKGEREERKPRNTGQNDTKKGPEDCGMSRSSGRNVGDGRRNKRQALRVYAYLFSSVVGALSMRSRN